MQVGTNFRLTDFDYAEPGRSNANTLFLYPTTNGASSVVLADRDARADSGGTNTPALPQFAPQPVRCQSSVSGGAYSCSLSMTLPDPIAGGARASAYLWLTAFYNATHFRVTLSNNGTPVTMHGAQPVVDATGRANSVLRRVQSRISLQGTFPYPSGAVDVTGNFCKNFGVTNEVGGYVNNDPTCAP